MTIQLSEHGNVKVLQLAGELTGGNEDFISRVTELLTDRRALIVVDLGDVHYMNSAGLGDLVRLAAQANVQEARFVLANLTPYLSGVLEMTRLDQFFEVHPSTEAAIRAVTE